jgi:alpha-L-fucosidase
MSLAQTSKENRMGDQQDLERVQAVIAEGPFADTWESLAGYQPPRWYCDAKFGIFIHWGVYSVPAFGNEWYARNMYQQGRPEYEHHRATYGPQDQLGYKDFIKDFSADSYDPVGTPLPRVGSSVRGSCGRTP